MVKGPRVGGQYVAVEEALGRFPNQGFGGKGARETKERTWIWGREVGLFCEDPCYS